MRSWFLTWRQQSFDYASAVTPRPGGKPLTQSQLHKYFFTSEATEDFIHMLEVIPRLVLTYAREYSPGQWTYIIPRHLSNDSQENRFAKIKLGVGHGRLDARSVLIASKASEVLDTHKARQRLHIREVELSRSRKTNCGETELHTQPEEGPLDDPPPPQAEQEALAAEKHHWEAVCSSTWSQPVAAVDALRTAAARHSQELCQRYAWLKPLPASSLSSKQGVR